MRRRRSFVQLLAVAIVIPLLTMLLATSAHADPIPATNWTPLSLSDIPAANTVITEPSGGVTVGCPSGIGNPTAMLKSFSATGNVVQDLSVGTNPTGWFCTANGAVGKDGTAYVGVGAANGTAQYIQAWKNNSLVWQYTIPCGPYGSPWAMTMGADGNLYVVIWQGSGSCASNQLIGLTPTAQAGINPPVPQVVMNLSLYNGGVSSQGLAAYGDGLALYAGSGIQYVSYSGTAEDPIPHPDSVNSYVAMGDRWFEATTSGRVFVPNRATSTQSTGCNNPSNAVASISAIDPDGGAGWTTSIFSACTYVKEIHPTPDGGFVMRYAYALPGSSNYADKVAAFGSTGGIKWSRDVDGVASVMSVDLNGNVALRGNWAPWHTINGSTYQFPEISFQLLSGVTGETISQINLRGESDTTSGPSYKWGNGGELAIAKNTAYIVAYQCGTLNSCDRSTTKLYAFTVPGLEMDYPRGAIFGAGGAPQNYVAMGDSFSAGQGVPPFSDTSGCNRSTRAYPELLPQSVAHPLTMQSFIACSGATTQDVRLGGVTGVNQPKQIDVLSTSTKIVTITIGGNDIGFGPLAEKCVREPNCTTSTEYGDALYKLTNVLPGALDQAYVDIKAKLGSGARVLVIGYPMMIPDPEINTLPNCPYLSHGEKAAARDVISQLNQAVQAAVGRAGAPFEYVDPNGAQSPFGGHELCMDDGYYNGVDLAHPDYSLHPNALGQDAFRWVIQTYFS